MLKILSPEQIRALDAHTIQEENIASFQLMERAALAFVNWYMQQFPSSQNGKVAIFCGPGNNGGDGLAIARLLNQKFYAVTVYICEISPNRSPDFEKNLKKIPRRRSVPVYTIANQHTLPPLEEDVTIIDALFGSGLNRPAEGLAAAIIQYINQLPNRVVSVDVPSGLFMNRTTEGVAIQADYTLSFELPKLAFFFAENAELVGKCFVQPIGLSKIFLTKTVTSHYLVTADGIASILKKRPKYSHKGTYGHALLWMGSHGKIGAAVLAARACLRSGAGLTTAYLPRCGYEIMQISCPEAMTLTDPNTTHLSTIPALEGYAAIGAGCGIGQEGMTEEALNKLLKNAQQPLVLDADALNLIAKNPEWATLLPKNSILTPHPKEFSRLFGETANDFARHELLSQQAVKYRIYIILKGANTCIACPDGTTYFNTTGNPGMATGGSGDVLTGILTGLLAQAYTPKEAALLGVYLHGLAGDLAVKDSSQESLIAGDLTDFLGKAFTKVNVQEIY